MPNKEDFDKYRFYQCVVTSDGYNCEQALNPNYSIKDNSKLIFINNNIPKIDLLEKRLLKCKLNPKIIRIKNN